MTIRITTKSSVLLGKPERHNTKFFLNKKIKVFHMAVYSNQLFFVKSVDFESVSLSVLVPGYPTYFPFPREINAHPLAVRYGLFNFRPPKMSYSVVQHLLNKEEIYRKQYVDIECKTNPSKYDLVADWAYNIIETYEIKTLTWQSV